MMSTQLGASLKQSKQSNPYARVLLRVCIEENNDGVVARVLNDKGEHTSVYVPYEDCIKHQLLRPVDELKLRDAQDTWDNQPF